MEEAIEYRSRLFHLQGRVSYKSEGYTRKLELTLGRFSCDMPCNPSMRRPLFGFKS